MPPQPQFSVSTSSMTTKVASSGLWSTSSSNWLVPAISAAFSSGRDGIAAGAGTFAGDLNGNYRQDDLP